MVKRTKKKFELVDLSNYIYGENNVYCLQWFEFLSYRETKVVIYGVGQWSYHLMDWRGCNFYHGRLPKSPVFRAVEEAEEWLRFQIQNGVYKKYMELSGHHAGEHKCSLGCTERKLNHIHFNKEGNDLR